MVWSVCLHEVISRRICQSAFFVNYLLFWAHDDEHKDRQTYPERRRPVRSSKDGGGKHSSDDR